MERFSPTAEEMAMQFKGEANFVAMLYAGQPETRYADQFANDDDAELTRERRHLRRITSRRT